MAQKHRDDRFAFSERGSFKISREGERVGLIAAILGLFLLICANVAFFIWQIAVSFSEAGFVYALRAILVVNLPWLGPLFLISVAEVLLFRFVRALIFRGNTVFYFADETFFSFRCPKRRLNLSVKYEDVVAVTYRERRALWYPRGYTVTIILTNEETLVFYCISYERTANLDRVLKKPDAFLILEERIETMRREKRDENFGRLF